MDRGGLSDAWSEDGGLSWIEEFDALGQPVIRIHEGKQERAKRSV